MLHSIAQRYPCHSVKVGQSAIPPGCAVSICSLPLLTPFPRPGLLSHPRLNVCENSTLFDKLTHIFPYPNKIFFIRLRPDYFFGRLAVWGRNPTLYRTRLLFKPVPRWMVYNGCPSPGLQKQLLSRSRHGHRTTIQASCQADRGIADRLAGSICRESCFTAPPAERRSVKRS